MRPAATLSRRPGTNLHPPSMSFTFEPLAIRDVVLVKPLRRQDERGFFEETFRASAFRGAGIDARFVQDNHARSTKGVVRGLHYSIPPAAAGKLVGVTGGTIFDVAVDLRKRSPTFARWVSHVLDQETGELLWIPPGFAHGYAVLSEVADVVYKVTEEYDPEVDRGIRWDDPTIDIQWPVEVPVLSERDRGLPLLSGADTPFHA